MVQPGCLGGDNREMSIHSAAVWPELVALNADQVDLSLVDRFVADPQRAESLSFALGDLWVDVAKHPIDAATLDLLFRLAKQRGVPEFFAAMIGGQVVNQTEGRPALHTALRASADAVIEVDGVNVVPEVHQTLGQMTAFTDALRAGQVTGATGHAIRAVVSLGIGGSHLGPTMAAEALAEFAGPLTVRWAANLDRADLTQALAGLDPASTLVVVCSKTFTTAETLAAAEQAQAWLAAGVGDDVSAHLAAATAAPERAEAWGVPADQVFTFPEWVGGRFSLASSVSLGLMAAIGAERFGEMLTGMRLVDDQVVAEERSVPVLLGLLDVWHRQVRGAASRAVVPYSHALRRFPDHLQQLEMESLGKSVSVDGRPVEGPTGAVIWGAAGTDAQHAFFQLLHQGPEVIPVDFIGFAQPAGGVNDALMANLLAQAEALAIGRSEQEVAATGVAPALVPHRTFAGGRPSTVILAQRLTPSVLGQLVALYEHRTVTAAVLWGINPFDQWGVELGKQLAVRIADELSDPESSPNHDSSTNSLMARYREWRNPS